MINKQFAWDAAKNRLLKEKRGIAFEDIVAAMGGGGLVNVMAHPDQKKYPGQKIYIVLHNNYAYLVPFVESEKMVFLKTIIPSRKATRDYMNR